MWVRGFTGSLPTRSTARGQCSAIEGMMRRNRSALASMSYSRDWPGFWLVPAVITTRSESLPSRSMRPGLTSARGRKGIPWERTIMGFPHFRGQVGEGHSIVSCLSISDQSLQQPGANSRRRRRRKPGHSHVGAMEQVGRGLVRFFQ